MADLAIGDTSRNRMAFDLHDKPIDLKPRKKRQNLLASRLGGETKGGEEGEKNTKAVSVIEPRG